MLRLDKLPWAALIAAAIVVYADRQVFADRECWKDIREKLEALPEPIVRVELGKTKDVLQLANLAEAPDDLRRLVVLGNSRARVGLNFRGLGDANIQLAKLAHAAVSPYVMRTMAREIAAAQPDICVLLLSELNTHRPVELVPSACFRSPEALAQLLSTEPAVAIRLRQEIEKVAVGSVLESYLHGDLLDRAYLNDIRKIRTQEPDPNELAEAEPDAEAKPEKGRKKGRRGQGRLRKKPIPRKQLEIESEDARFPIQRIEEPEVPPPPVENIQAIRAQIDEHFNRKRVKNSTLDIGYTIQKGAHVNTQLELLRSTIEILRDSGSEVLILEGPLNPLMNLLYDEEGTRAEFLAFVEEMEQEHGVHFQSLEETGPFTEKDFADLLHLNGSAARRLSEKVKQRIVAILDARQAR